MLLMVTLIPRYLLGQLIHFFRFPLTNELLTKKWVDALKRKKFKLSQSSRICSVDFAEQDFQLQPYAHRPLLKDNIIPSIFPAFPFYYQKINKSSC
ncbi:Uncharacterized protein FWK35_00012329 [Aphis craccivora]|uniref:THAP-type domain-containing protein n=1 Tax=Aphis craccivora TaxID=307492 RepID=A0A6G0YUK9_APHCR|nr:Uncharacterized protein FWK35_00012329 [Aphis craccivora]